MSHFEKSDFWRNHSSMNETKGFVGSVASSAKTIPKLLILNNLVESRDKGNLLVMILDSDYLI